MSDLKTIIGAVKKIESILEQRFGGHGRGLHEKLNQASVPIPESLVKSVRYIATLRNKALHEDGFEIDDPEAFLATCERTLAQLERLAQEQEQRGAVPAGRAPVGQGQHRWVWLAVLTAVAMLAGWIFFGQDSRRLPDQELEDRAARRAVPSNPAPAEAPAARPLPASKPAPKPAPKPASRSLPEPERAANSASNSPPANAEPAQQEPIGISQIRLAYGRGVFDEAQAQVSATFTNRTGRTLSSLKLDAELFLNRQPEGLTGQLWANFGERGLLAGQTRTLTLKTGRMDNAVWVAPDVLNASSRRVELAVSGYTDGSHQSADYLGPRVSSAWTDTAASAKPVADKAAESRSARSDEPVGLGGISIRYGQGVFNDPEARIEVTIVNHSPDTLASVRLAARLFLDGQSETVFSSGHRQLQAFFGERGLPSGQRRTLVIKAGRMHESEWVAPDVLNAKARRVELAVLGYTDGRQRQVELRSAPGPQHWQAH